LRGSTLFLRSNLERMLLQHDLLWWSGSLSRPKARTLLETLVSQDMVAEQQTRAGSGGASAQTLRFLSAARENSWCQVDSAPPP
jgi:hypothetical protein